jgi:hypothetical protein
MNNSYPARHSFHSYEHAGNALPPLCVYCLHLLGTAPVTPSKRRELEERHVCGEKVTVLKPSVSLPFN